MIIDERMSAFIDSLDSGNPAWLNEIEKYALDTQVPIIRRSMQSLLKFLLTYTKPKSILEVGTAIGFSALLMSEYAPTDCPITTIEKYEKRIPIARENFDKYGRKDKITLLEGDATEILKELDGTYDVIFMDAAKGQYINFLPDILRLLGQIDKYTWVNYGSSYLPSDMNAAYLYAQLEIADEINEARLACWNRYYEQLKPLKDAGKIDLPTVPEGCVHNAHMFYIKARDLEQRTRFISYMKENGVLVVFHYIPLHTAPAGQKFGRFHGEDRYTTRESERLARLPMYYGLTLDQVDYICGLIKDFFELEEQ